MRSIRNEMNSKCSKKALFMRSKFKVQQKSTFYAKYTERNEFKVQQKSTFYAKYTE